MRSPTPPIPAPALVIRCRLPEIATRSVPEPLEREHTVQLVPAVRPSGPVPRHPYRRPCTPSYVRDMAPSDSRRYDSAVGPNDYSRISHRVCPMKNGGPAHVGADPPFV